MTIVGLLGSGEFLPWAADVDRFLLDAARTGDGTALIVPTASAPEGDEVFERWARMGTDHYAGMNVASRVLPMKTRDDALRPEIAAAFEEPSLIFFSGGNPAYLAQVLRDTPSWDAIGRAMERGVAVAGCSAGACIFGEQAPDPTRIESIEEAFAPRGLAVFPGIVFGAHWDMLDTYYPNLRRTTLALLPDGCRLIGLDEDTAMASNGKKWHVFGKAGVHVYGANGDGPVSYVAGQTFGMP